MKLLIVVNKLLTGFDAPRLHVPLSSTNPCRTTASSRPSAAPTGMTPRSKEFGYIVDYKDLFKKVENAIRGFILPNWTAAMAAMYDPQVLLKDRLKKGRERLDNALEAGCPALRTG